MMCVAVLASCRLADSGTSLSLPLRPFSADRSDGLDRCQALEAGGDLPEGPKAVRGEPWQQLNLAST
jgi:hypothetical protein